MELTKKEVRSNILLLVECFSCIIIYTYTILLCCIEQDEGEHESRDVDAAPPPPPPRPAARNVPPPVPPVARPPTAAAQRAAPPPPFQQQQQRPPPARVPGSNPYASSRNVLSSMSSAAAASRPAPAVSSATRAVVDLSVDDEPAQGMDLVTPTNNSTVTDPSLASASRASLPSQDTSSLSQDTRVSHMDTEPLSFTELLELVAKLQTDQQLYRQYESKMFVVPCKMLGHHQYFNIDKKKKKKRDRRNKDDKVRRYCMNWFATDRNDFNNGLTLSCIISFSV